MSAFAKQAFLFQIWKDIVIILNSLNGNTHGFITTYLIKWLIAISVIFQKQWFHWYGIVKKRTIEFVGPDLRFRVNV